MERKLSKKAALPTMAALQLLSTACGGYPGGGPDSRRGTPIPEPTQAPLPDSVKILLDYPFPKEYYPKVKIQQGWLYQDSLLHDGIDFINGEIDNSSTWQSFPVLAADEGRACIPTHRQGNAVLIRHPLMLYHTKRIDTYYGHLKDFMNALPSCDKPVEEWVEVSRGQQIGEAGSTGTDKAGLIHLHFQVNAAGEPIDPYGVFGKRDKYPDIHFTNSNKCGDIQLLIACFRPPTLAKSVPTLSPTAARIAATETATPRPLPTNTPRPLPTETQRPVPTATTRVETNRNLPLNQQAQIEAFNLWIDYLKREEVAKGIQFDGTFSKEITYITPVGNRPFNAEDLINKRITSENALIRLSWRLINNYSGMFSGIPIGGYFRGETEIKIVELKVNPYQLTPAQRSNGITFMGYADIVFVSRDRGRYSTKNMPPSPSPDQPWGNFRDEFRRFSVKLQNNQWLVEPSYEGSPFVVNQAHGNCDDCPTTIR